MRQLHQAFHVSRQPTGLHRLARMSAILLSVAAAGIAVVAVLSLAGGAQAGSADEVAALAPPGRRVPIIRDLAVASDGDVLTCRMGTGRLLQWSLAENRCLRRIDLTARRHGTILAASLSADGTTTATGWSDGSVKISRGGRTRTVRLNHSGKAGPPPVWAVACSADGRRVAWAAGRALALWDTQSHEFVFRERDEGWDGQRILFSADGSRLVVVHRNERMQVWNAETGALVRAFHVPNVGLVAASPDGRCLAVSGPTGRLGLWSSETGLPTAELPRRESHQIFAAAFSPDGRMLACGCADGSIELWPVASDAKSEEWKAHAAGVCGLRFGAASDRLWSAGLHGTIRLWSLEPPVEVVRIELGANIE